MPAPEFDPTVRPMRILLTIHLPLDPDAGAPGAVMQLASEYRRAGHHVDILSLDDFPLHVPLRLRPLLFPWLVRRRVRQSARHLDVVDASSGDAWLYTRTRTDPRLGHVLRVTHNHGLEHTVHNQLLYDARCGNIRLSWKYPIYNGGFRLWAAKRSYQQADLCFFLNKPDLEYAVTHLQVSRDRVRLTANGLPNSFLRLPFLPTPSDPGAPVLIAHVGSYSQRKGIDYTRIALHSLMSDYPSVHCAFFGPGCDTQRVLQDFDPAIRNRIQITARFRHGDLPSMLRRYHIALLPSLAEGFPMSLLEAMSCGLAAVTTNVPGPPEIVDPDVEGIIVPPRSASAIDVALRRLIDNRSLLHRMRTMAYERAQRYRWHAIAASRLAMYQEFVAKKCALLANDGFIAATAPVCRHAMPDCGGEHDR